MKTVLVSQGPTHELSPLRAALAAVGYQVIECGGAWETLQLVDKHHVDVFITAAALPDISGYHLACLLKSMESAKEIPVIVVKASSQGAGSRRGREIDTSTPSPAPALATSKWMDEFSLLAKRCRMIVEVADSIEALKMLQTMLPRAEQSSGSTAGSLPLYKSGRVTGTKPEDRLLAKSIFISTTSMLNELLVERVVVDKAKTLLAAIESRRAFAEHYFDVAAQLVDCSVCGMVVACTAKPWGAIRFSGRFNKDGLHNWLKNICEDSLEGLYVDFEISGELYNEGEPLPVPEVMEVRSKDGIQGLLVFAPAHSSGFDQLSRKAMRSLHRIMEPIMQLRLDKERLSDKQKFPVVTDELTGAYNLDFLIGFMQQQLLFSFRQRTPLALILLQIDGISDINLKVGWEAGDHLLVQSATWLANHTRGSDIVARCSGNTFAIVLPASNLDGARVAAVKFAGGISNLPLTKGAVPLKIRTGCAVAKPSELNPEILLRDAQDDLKIESHSSYR